MLTIKDGKIHGNSYNIRHELKKLGCKFDAESKLWTLPEENYLAVFALMDKTNEQEEEKIHNTWRRACEFFNYKFVKKGTPEYDKVKTKFLELLKSN